MATKQCALCDIQITPENDSKEHVIPNSIGGRKKIRGFLCTPCNNGAGETWDAEFAQQYHFFSLFFSIDRDRGEIPALILPTINSGNVILHADGQLAHEKPHFEEIEINEEKQIQIRARSLKEAARMAKGLKRKYPEADIDKAMAEAKEESHYLNDVIVPKLSFGGKKAGKSIVKTCLALAVEAGIRPQECKEAQLYLKNDDAEACFGYYYENDLLLNRPSETVFHCVAIHGNQKTQQLLGYVEYFSSIRMVICLSSSYQGHEFKSVYAIDPLSAQELDLDISIPLSQDDIQATYRYERVPDNTMAECLNAVFPIAIKRNYERERNRVINQAVDNFFKTENLKEGDILTEKQVAILSREVSEKLTQLVIHQLKGFSP